MMRRPPSTFRSLRGFTLLEILIATVVGAIVLLVINATFFGALRLSNTTHDRIASDLEVQRAPSGEPRLVLSGRAADLASQRSVRTWLVSLTHTSTTAAAVVVALA